MLFICYIYLLFTYMMCLCKPYKLLLASSVSMYSLFTLIVKYWNGDQPPESFTESLCLCPFNICLQHRAFKTHNIKGPTTWGRMGSLFLTMLPCQTCSAINYLEIYQLLTAVPAWFSFHCFTYYSVSLLRLDFALYGKRLNAFHVARIRRTSFTIWLISHVVFLWSLLHLRMAYL